MKKQDKINLAKKCYDRIKDLGLNVEVDGFWVIISPPLKTPTDLLIDIAECDSKYLIKLING